MERVTLNKEVLQIRAEGVRNLRNEFEKLTCQSRWISRLFILVVVFCAFWALFVIAYVKKPDEFMRVGAGLLLIATIVSIWHILKREKLLNAIERLHSSFFPPVQLVEETSDETSWNQQSIEVEKLVPAARGLATQELRKVLWWEASLATVGTFVWGFGDLILCLFTLGGFKCSA